MSEQGLRTCIISVLIGLLFFGSVCVSCVAITQAQVGGAVFVEWVPTGTLAAPNQARVTWIAPAQGYDLICVLKGATVLGCVPATASSFSTPSPLIDAAYRPKAGDSFTVLFRYPAVNVEYTATLGALYPAPYQRFAPAVSNNATFSNIAPQ